MTGLAIPSNWTVAPMGLLTWRRRLYCPESLRDWRRSRVRESKSDMSVHAGRCATGFRFDKHPVAQRPAWSSTVGNFQHNLYRLAALHQFDPAIKLLHRQLMRHNWFNVDSF